MVGDSSAVSAITDGAGRFALRPQKPVAALTITHPGFETFHLSLAGAAAPIRIALTPLATLPGIQVGLARELLRHNCTVIAILHDLNVACEYGDHFVVLHQGRVAGEVDRAQELSTGLIDRVFSVRSYRVPDPEGGIPVWRFRPDR